MKSRKKYTTHPILITIIVSVLVLETVYLKTFIRPILMSYGLSELRSKWLGDIFINFTMFFGILWFIKKNSLENLAGLGKPPLINKKLLLFPLLILLPMSTNLFELNFGTVNLTNLLLLLIWSLSIGYFEESALRGLLQSTFINRYWKRKNGVFYSVIFSSLIFGLLHLISWKNSIFYEFNQVAVATILGIMFGALLLRTNKLYPIIIMHALFDFFSGLDDLKLDSESINPTVSLSPIEEFNVTFILLPFLVFGVYQLIKIRKETIEVKVP